MQHSRCIVKKTKMAELIVEAMHYVYLCLNDLYLFAVTFHALEHAVATMQRRRNKSWGMQEKSFDRTQ